LQAIPIAVPSRFKIFGIRGTGSHFPASILATKNDQRSKEFETNTSWKHYSTGAMEDQNCCLLALPEDILLVLVSSWLVLKETVLLDTAGCVRSLRTSYHRATAKCSVDNIYRVQNGLDRYIKWLAARNNGGLSTLVVSKAMSAEFERNSEHSASALRNVSVLVASQLSARNLTGWLAKIAPFCINLRKLVFSDLSKDNSGWILNFGDILRDVTHLDFTFAVYDRLPLMQQLFERCESLRYLQWFNHDCAGMEVLVQKNVNLVHIHLTNCMSPTQQAFTAIINLPHTKYIHLCQNANIERVGELNATTTTLTTFRLEHFNGLTEQAVLRVIRAFPRRDILCINLHCLENVEEAFVEQCRAMGFNRVKYATLKASLNWYW